MSKTFCSYFIPCSNQHHACQQFGTLKNRHKFAAVFAGFFAGFFSLPLGGICGLAAFRKVVEMNKNSKFAKASQVYSHVHGKKAQTNSQPKKSKGVSFFQPLKALIPTIANPQKKAIYQKGLKHFEKLGLKSDVHAYRLGNNADFVYTQTEEPLYFADTFKPNMPKIFYVEDIYNYIPFDSDTEDFWVIFSSARLGGRCFDNGGAMQEIAAMEMPQYAGFVASHQKQGLKKGGKHFCTVSIRDGQPAQRYKVAEGQPNPLLLTGIYRVQEVHKDAKSSFRAKVFDSPSPKVNLLAIAAPKLEKAELPYQCDYKTAKDLFNSIMAGFSLVEKKYTGTKIPMIHSGKLGAGAYNNDPRLVYVLHLLAAKQLNLQLGMHGYTKEEAERAYSIFHSVDLRGKTLSECVELLADAVYLDAGGEA